MSNDLGNYRIIADESQATGSQKDWFEQTKDNNTSVVKNPKGGRVYIFHGTQRLS